MSVFNDIPLQAVAYDSTAETAPADQAQRGRHKAGKLKRTQAQIARDRALITRWSTLGLSNGEIAKRLGEITLQDGGYVLSLAQVDRDLNESLEAFAASVELSTHTYRLQQLARLRQYRVMILQRIEQAEQEQTETTIRKKDVTVMLPDPNDPAKKRRQSLGEQVEIQERRRTRIAPPAFFDTLVRLEEREAALLGLDKPPLTEGDEEAREWTPPPPKAIEYQEAAEAFYRLGRGDAEIDAGEQG